MAPRASIDQRIFVYDVIQSESKGGRVRLNLGDARSNKGFYPNVAFWGADGFLGRPVSRTDDGAAQAFLILDGFEGRVVQTRDNRFPLLVGDLAEGDRAIVSDSKALLYLERAADKIYLRTNDGDDLQEVVLDGAGKVNEITCGKAKIHMEGDSITMQVGKTKLVLKDGSFQVLTDSCELTATQVLLGKEGSGQAPTPSAANAVLAGTLATAVNSTQVYAKIGP